MVNRENKTDFQLLICITLISISLFMYEVIISRLFSVLLSYHYVYFIISIAILGMGLGSMIEYKLIQNEENIAASKNIGRLIILLSIIIIISFALIYLLPYMSMSIYILISILPYIIGGRIFTKVFTMYGKDSNKIYFADLIGAGFAAILSIILLYRSGFIITVHVLFIMLLLTISIWFYKREKYNIISYSTLGIIIFSIVVSPFTRDYLEKNFVSYLSSPSTSIARLRNANLKYDIISTKWDGFARTDVVKIEEDDNKRIITINGSANAAMLKWDGKTKNVTELKESIDFLPYLLGENRGVAIIGAGGGRDVLQAIIGGAQEIDAIEINQSAIDAVKEMGEYNGNIYDHPSVNVLSGDGRSIIAKSEKKYDLIFAALVMTDTTESMGYAMAESYIYTKEALQVYYDKLKPNGKLVFVTHGISDTYKISNTGFDILKKNDVPIEQVKDHLIIGANIEAHGENVMYHMPIIVISKQKFTVQQLNKASNFFEKNKFKSIHFPGNNEDSYFKFISDGKFSLEDIYGHSPENIKPATDESPFFYNFSKGVPDVFKILFLLIALFVVLFIKPIYKDNSYRESFLFSILGVVFMLVEIGFIQKFTLFLEHPTVAFVTVVGSLLIGSGIGSFFSNSKYLIKHNKHWGPVLASISIICSTLLINYGLLNMLNEDLYIKLIITIVVLLINGFFMGMIFPYSIKRVTENNKSNLIPILYGINGIFSVLGSVLAIIISMQLSISESFIRGYVIFNSKYIDA